MIRSSGIPGTLGTTNGDGRVPGSQLGINDSLDDLSVLGTMPVQVFVEEPGPNKVPTVARIQCQHRMT
jgi:hypothetical protein